jgi:hypothetical protein
VLVLGKLEQPGRLPQRAVGWVVQQTSGSMNASAQFEFEYEIQTVGCQRVCVPSATKTVRISMPMRPKRTRT